MLCKILNYCKVIERISDSMRFESKLCNCLNCNFSFSLLVTHTSPLWENKPWVCTSQTTMFVWTPWLMCCTTHRSPWSPHAPWSILDSENCLLVSKTWLALKALDRKVNSGLVHTDAFSKVSVHLAENVAKYFCLHWRFRIVFTCPQ